MPETMTRAEHLQWCKERALAYLAPTGQVFTGRYVGTLRGGRKKELVEMPLPVGQQHMQDAWASLVSDLGKHPQTAGHMGIQLGQVQLLAGLFRTPAELRRFIEGFH